jgi:DNA topoisomerase-1
MPKKPKKTREEKAVESYFPVDETSLKHTTEKQEKEKIPKEEDILKNVTSKSIKENIPEEMLKHSVEKKSSKPDKKSLEIVEKISNKTLGNYKREYTIPKIELKESGYELIITEKPQAALKISSALGKSRKNNIKGVPYYEVNRNGKNIVVACAVGHLFTLTQNTTGSSVPVFDIDWVPNFYVRKKDFTKRYYDLLLRLIKGASSLIVETDYDIEGEVIGYNVVRFIGNQKDAKRMKFSTLTEKELNEAYEKMSSHINWGQAIAGETRHYLDWFYGINLSRALMNAIKSAGKFRIMSIGRVQGPALNLIVKKEKEIQAFVTEPYWQVFATINDGKNTIELKHNKDLFDKNELKKFENLAGKKVNVETKKIQQILPPNPPFNLTTLQTEAYKFYGITPANTLKTAQSLYLAGLISYPRTSSQKLPEAIGYKEILKKLAKEYHVESLTVKEKPVEGKKTDPAHPSIYPTGEKQILTGNEEKIYGLIVKRFLSLFCENAIIDKKNISFETDNLKFAASGSAIRKKAWMAIYPSKLKETELPDINGEAKIIDSKIEEKQTQPPKRYSQASIISELEKKNLGTKATRSSILETLYERGYIKEKSIEATPIGISLIDTMQKYSPIIIDEKLTRSFEDSMESIVNLKKGFTEKEEKIIDSAKKTIIKIAEQFVKNEKEIGRELVDANEKHYEQQREENKLITCPVCNKGNLAITYSRKTRRNFVACDAFPECKNTYSLPPGSIIKKTDKVCEKCGFPMLMSIKNGKRPWIFCFNTDCITNKERIEEYRRKLDEKNN